MVFVKVRETYDLHTVTNKITAIGIHTPAADIIKRNYPGLLMQCKSYRPVKCDIAVACASMLPADPLQVSTTSGDIAPEDLFNPILYKACTNHGMSQIEARINAFNVSSSAPASDVTGSSASVDNDSFTGLTDEFNLYYGMLSDTHQWRHASPQSGFSMRGLKPLVYEMLYSNADMNNEYTSASSDSGQYSFPDADGYKATAYPYVFKGHPKTMPFINCTSYTQASGDSTSVATPGFHTGVNNAEVFVPAPKIYVGCIIVPPSRLHQLYYRMVVEWTLEFSGIRSVGEITDWTGLAAVGANQHYQSYDYSAAKAVAGVDEDVLDSDTAMVSANTEINKVM